MELDALMEKYGPDSIAGFISPDVSNEAAYMFQKFLRINIGTNNVIALSGPEVSWDPIRSIYQSLGLLTLSPPIRYLKEADCILVLQSEPLTGHNELIQMLSEAKSERHCEIISVGQNQNALSKLATVQIKVPPAAEAEILRSILLFMNHRGGTDREVVWRDCEGFQKLLSGLHKFRPEKVAEKWDISEELILKIALTVTRKRKLSIILASEGFPDYQEYRLAKDAMNIILASGNLGIPGRGFYYIPRYQNAVGVAMMGCSPNFLPGFAPFSDESARDWFTTSWGSNLPEQPGLTIDEFFHPSNYGKIKGLIYLGGSPADYLPGYLNYHKICSEMTLIAGAGEVLDPNCHFWWPLNPNTKNPGSIITQERRLSLRTVEANSDLSCYNDWELIGHWMNSLEGLENDISWDSIFKEMTDDIPCLTGVESESLNENEVICHRFNSDNDEPIYEYPLSSLPRITFANVPKPLENNSNGIAMTLRLLHPDNHQLDKMEFTQNFEIPILWIHPEDAENHQISDNSYIQLTYNQRNIVAFSSVTEKISKNCVVAWFARSEQAKHFLPQGEECPYIQLHSMDRGDSP